MTGNPGQGQVVTAPDAQAQGRSSRWKTALLVLVLAASALRFVYEVRLILGMCCYDFPLFWRQVEGTLRGGDLYVAEPAFYGPGEGTYKYPPLFAVFLLPWVGRIGLDEAKVGYLLMQVAFYFASLGVLTHVLNGGAKRDWRLALPLLLALNHGPFFETLLRLQYEGPILLVLVLALALTLAGRDFCAGLVLSVGAMLKVYPAAMLAFYVARRRWAALAGFGVGLAALLALGIAVFGMEQNARFFLRILPFMAREAPTEMYGSENASVARQLIIVLGLRPAVARYASDAIGWSLMAISVAVVAMRGRRSSSRAETTLAYGLFVPTMLLMLPNSWTNYQLLLLLPAVCLVAFSVRAGRLGWPAQLALAALVLASYHKDTYYYPFTFLGRVPYLTETWQGLRPLCSAGVWLAMLYASGSRKASALAVRQEGAAR